MGKPGSRHGLSSTPEYIGSWRPTGRTETSKYPQEKKSNEIPEVAASETGGAQTRGNSGVVGPERGLPAHTARLAEAIWNDPPQRVRDPYAKDAAGEWLRYLSTAGHEKSRRNLGGPPSKATYSSVTDSAPVP
jgi:hypothetical protein